MSWLPFIGYGATAIAVALYLMERQRAKRLKERLQSTTTRLEGEANAYKSALDRATDRIKQLGDHSYNSGLHFDESGSLQRD